jgi:hypothetical protein
MTEWTKVVIYPLGLCGFALYLLYMIYIRREKRRARGEAVSVPVFLYGLAGISLIAGLTLAFFQLVIPVFTTVFATFDKDYQELVSAARDGLSPDQAPSAQPDSRFDSSNFRYRIPVGWTTRSIRGGGIQLIPKEATRGTPLVEIIMADWSDVDSAASALTRILEDSHIVWRREPVPVAWDPPIVQCLQTEFTATDPSISASVIRSSVVVCRSPHYLNLILLSASSDSLYARYLPDFGTVLEQTDFADALPRD